MLKKSTLFISINPPGGLIEIQQIMKPPLGGLGVKSDFFHTPIISYLNQKEIYFSLGVMQKSHAEVTDPES